MHKKAAKVIFGFGIALLLCTLIVGYTIHKMWTEGVVTYEETDDLVITNTRIEIEQGILVAISELTNTTGTIIRDAGYSAQFTSLSGKYLGTTLGPVPTVDAHNSIQFRIEISLVEEVKDASSVILDLELFLPKNEGG